jgi:hypothetical protein
MYLYILSSPGESRISTFHCASVLSMVSRDLAVVNEASAGPSRPRKATNRVMAAGVQPEIVLDALCAASDLISRTSSMASTTAFAYNSADELYEHIDAQFQLSSSQLVELTKAFLQEFKQGLESYGQAMAMMYVLRRSVKKCS